MFEIKKFLVIFFRWLDVLSDMRKLGERGIFLVNYKRSFYSKVFYRVWRGVYFQLNDGLKNRIYGKKVLFDFLVKLYLNVLLLF